MEGETSSTLKAADVQNDEFVALINSHARAGAVIFKLGRRPDPVQGHANVVLAPSDRRPDPTNSIEGLSMALDLSQTPSTGSWTIEATDWRPGERPVPVENASDAPSTGIRWIEVNATPVRAGQVFERLSSVCAGLTREMVEDLLTPDQEPLGKPYPGGDIRLASSCRLEARSEGSAKNGDTDEVGGHLTIQPIELLAGEGWLITCWHHAQTFRDGRFSDVRSGTPEAGAVLHDSVARRWEKGLGRSAADLGTLVLHELVLGYGAAERTLDTWLEHWELAHHQSVLAYSELSVRDRSEDFGKRAAMLRKQHAQLAELSGAMAVLRAWITPQNRVGLKEDPERAWLVPADPTLVCDVDDRIDRALAELRELSQALRSSFSLLQFQQLETQRDRREQLMRRIEIVAAAFLIPTLIVGFYGANTWVPGQQEHWGFWVMIVVLVVLSVIGITAVILYQNWQSRWLEREPRSDGHEKRLRGRGER
jgi:CorA-like Mg2+ transporter protein